MTGGRQLTKAIGIKRRAWPGIDRTAAHLSPWPGSKITYSGRHFWMELFFILELTLNYQLMQLFGKEITPFLLSAADRTAAHLSPWPGSKITYSGRHFWMELFSILELTLNYQLMQLFGKEITPFLLKLWWLLNFNTLTYII